MIRPTLSGCGPAFWMVARSKKAERRTPRFTGLHSASPRSSAAARATSGKSGTKCEIALRRELWRRGLRYRLNVPGLPGKPDIVFASRRLAIFCDGDFWHGRDLEQRLERLDRGHNSKYWVAKIRRNAERDLETNLALAARGWRVVRFWETDVLRQPAVAADRIEELLAVPNGVPFRNRIGTSTLASRG